MEPPVREALVDAYRRGSLSLRGFDRSLRVAQTIADLDGRDEIRADDVSEALGFRVTTRESVSA